MKTVDESRTKFKTLTVHGTSRKRARLIAKYVQDNHPSIYAKAFTFANKVIDADNTDETSGVMAEGLGVVHAPSPKLIEEVQKQRHTMQERIALLTKMYGADSEALEEQFKWFEEKNRRDAIMRGKP